MRLRSTIGFFKKAIGEPYPHTLRQEMSYSGDSDRINVEIDDFTPEQIARLERAAKKSEEPEVQRLAKKIDAYRRLSSSSATVSIGNLERLVTVMKAYIGQSPHKFLFLDHSDGSSLPYFVEEIEYVPREKNDPAQVNLTCLAMCRGGRESFTVTWRREHLEGKPTASQLLHHRNLYLETPAAYTAWLEEIKVYHEIKDKVGTQWAGEGFDSGSSALERDGTPARLVLDDDDTDEEDEEASDRKSDLAWVSTLFWEKAETKQKAAAEEDEDEDEDQGGEEEVEIGSAMLPIHPYIQFFDLNRHGYSRVHVNYVSPYKYQDNLDTKLVLPATTKELINLLIEGASEVMEDIIRGKTGGVVVACTGLPGTGKTLTAEVYAEHIKKPLYMVQCSQLGTDEEELEKKLNLVLRRASRWGAILLIDEADVYVRERGIDIQQNAIVGVFLRLLERYRGVLFLTSNRATTIDDAVMSRCIAHVKYGMPSAEELTQLWDMLSLNYGESLSPQDIATLVKQFPGISGRNVKNLIKLAKMVAAKRRSKLTAAIVTEVSSFVELVNEKK